MQFMRMTICAVAVAATAACAAMTIAERGAEPAYAIVLPDKPSPSETYAAEELRDHVKALVGGNDFYSDQWNIRNVHRCFECSYVS